MLQHSKLTLHIVVALVRVQSGARFCVGGGQKVTGRARMCGRVFVVCLEPIACNYYIA